MSSALVRLDAYLERYCLVNAAAARPEGKEMTALLACYSPNVVYTDAPNGGVWKGHDKVKRMIVTRYRFGHGDRRIVNRHTDGVSFAYELEADDLNRLAGDEPCALRSCSYGVFDDDGLVLEQRDYWDVASWVQHAGIDRYLDNRDHAQWRLVSGKYPGTELPEDAKRYVVVSRHQRPRFRLAESASPLVHSGGD
jgi:hypothetical protein